MFHAFYPLLYSFPGLAYCRHLSTVRTHLSALVNTTIVDPDVPSDAQGGLSLEVWEKILKDSSVRLTQKIHKKMMLDLTMQTLNAVCDLMFRPMRRRRYTGSCILVVWLRQYVKRSGLSSWGTTSSI